MGKEVKVKRMYPGATVPTYGSKLSAGADLYACLSKKETTLLIPAGATAVIGTGIAMEIPEGYAGLIYARSGLASKEGLAPANKVGVVDADYRGEIKVALHNHSNKDRVVIQGQRIAQMVITPFLAAQFMDVKDGELNKTVRNDGGFGHTGK